MVNIFGEEEDKRASWFELKNAGAENEFVAVNKFNKEYFNIPLLHLTEMYLTRAEANARLGNISGAVDDINTIIDRAYKTAAQQLDPSISQDALLEIIEKERQLELCFEGDHSLFKKKGRFL